MGSNHVAVGSDGQPLAQVATLNEARLAAGMPPMGFLNPFLCAAPPAAAVKHPSRAPYSKSAVCGHSLYGCGAPARD
jgi:hypothetical protein